MLSISFTQKKEEKKRSQFLRPYAEILCLPFALLADKTFLPLAVLILERNP